MVDGTSKSSTDEHKAELVTIDEKVAAIAVGLNAVIAVEMRRCMADEDGDAYGALLGAMGRIVFVFDGEDAAKEIMDAYTNGAFSTMSDLVEEGVSPDMAATIATEPGGSDNVS